MTDIVTGERSRCVHCRQKIAAVIDPSSGVVDWGSDIDHALGIPLGLDFGCSYSPDTTDEGTGSHDPGKGHTPCGFKILIDSRTYWSQVDGIRNKEESITI